MGKKKIIIDTDIGDDIDDALALAYALNSEELDILGITTVYKNTKARTQLVMALLEQYGRLEIPVFSGIGMPLIERVDLETPPAQCQVLKKQYSVNEQIDASDFIIRTMREQPDAVIAAIGPLTNIAVAFLRAPEVLKNAEIVAMGGNFKEVYAEWNILCDPEAARIVFDFMENGTILGLNVTNRCRLQERELYEIQKSVRPQAEFLRALIKNWFETTAHPVILHDPLIMEYLIDSSIAECSKLPITVELSGTSTRGVTFEKVDLFTPENVRPGKIAIGIEVDSNRVVSEFMKRVFQ